MDSLASFIKSKKVGVSSSSTNTSDSSSKPNHRLGNKKFLTRKEREKQAEEEEKLPEKELRIQKERGSSAKRKRSRNEIGTGTAIIGTENTGNGIALPRDEVIKRLRALGHPITLFGESDETRLERLTNLEQTGFRLEGLVLQGAHARSARDDQIDGSLDVISKQKKKKKSGKIDTEAIGKGNTASNDNNTSDAKKKDLHSGENKTADLGLNKDFAKKTSPEKHIYRFLKKMMYEWGEELDSRPEEEKRKAQGKLATRTYKQCKDYLKPFYHKLKTKTVEKDIVVHVDKIVSLCEEREYQTASDWYVRLAIGNAPWPIGVTMVGIHERSGRERIESSKVAHVMNDEEQRKYITSLKRLMTFCQRKYPTDPSKCVG
uniref:Pre-mRNA-splicing factor 18 n=1 Tax=Aplanochytrium stocchinoi TaxID=215587 RepID=A0A7S3PGW5_9STRA|mmetsp:Transcript_3845/g.4788  ORF Transcript_3845/g.4788 Transcript_3845/m.4788 type:complete len:375 (+) Transcript_3845:446-1570(+)